MNSFVAAIVAITLSIRYAPVLGIRIIEIFRYLHKSLCLSLCYAAFGEQSNLRQAVALGKAAFLSCCYDVFTDWQRSDENGGVKFQEIARSHAPTAAVQIGMELYWKDVRGELVLDGLERGVLALRCIEAILGQSRHGCMMHDIQGVGIVLQIVDDVLDYEGDLARGEINCLTSLRRDQYLRLLIDKASCMQIADVCSRSTIMRIAVARAVKKATRMLNDGHRVRQNIALK